jgi:uncharacterized protein (DUF305 family)
MKLRILAFAIAAATAMPAFAQMHDMQDMHMNQSMMHLTRANPYPPAEMKMHQRMMAAVGDDATETWVRKMIEHHRGGIETSHIVLQHTNDPKVRQMATKTIAEQTREVDELNGWLRAHGKRPE